MIFLRPGEIRCGPICGLLMLLSLLSGCAASRSDLIEAGTVNVDVVPMSHSSLRYISVDATGDETVVSGQVKRLGVYTNPFVGAKVYAEAIYPDGSRQIEVDTRLQRLPRLHNFRTIYPDATFRIVFPNDLPSGTIIHLKFTAPGSEVFASIDHILY